MAKSQQNYNFIARIAGWFVQNSRASILILVALFGAGIISYTTLLQRQGFPAIEFPIVVIQGTYFVDDQSQVDKLITEPLEDSLAQLEEVDTINSSTSANFVSVVAYLDADVDSEEGADIVEEELAKIAFPEEANVAVLPINPTAVDGVNDLVFAVSNSDLSIEELEEEVERIEDALVDLAEVKEVNVGSWEETRTNPLTGETTTLQTGFNRSVFKQGDDLLFEEAISVGLVKDPNIDAVGFSEVVRSEIEKLQEDKDISRDTTVIYGSDIAVEVEGQISSLEQNTLSALVIILVVVLLFINWRGAIVSALFLPFVLASVFFSLYLLGYTLNVISLFALILVIGLLVDDIIVVVEAIDVEKQAGSNNLEAVKKALQKIGAADTLGTLTTVAVFVPMLSISGILGEFISLIPITVILTLVISLVSALTVFSWLSSWLLANKVQIERAGTLYTFLNLPGLAVEKIGGVLAGFVKIYTRRWLASLGMIMLSFILSAIMLGSSVSGIRFDIFPSPKDSDQISIAVSFDDQEDMDVQKAEVKAKEIEDILVNYADFITYASYIGQGSDGQPSEEGYTISMWLTPMESREKTAVELVESLNGDFEDYNGAKVEAGIISTGPPSSEYPFQLQLFGDDATVLDSASLEIQNFIEDYEFEVEEGENIEVVEVKISNLDNISKVDRKRFGLLQVAFSVDDADTLLIRDLQDKIEAEFEAERLEELGLDDDALGFDQGIESDNMDSFQQAVVAFMASLVIMYGLLVVLFNSFTQPLLIFMAIPFSLVGVIPGLVATDNALSFFVLIGVIALAGIVVNNTILLIDYANQLRKEGSTISEAIVESVRTRFRPLITTSVTTIVGLVPLAISDPFWESLAFTIVFGLAASTIFVVIFFPAYYLIVESMKAGLYNLFNRTKES